MARMPFFSGDVGAAATTVSAIVEVLGPLDYVSLQSSFDYGSGGTTCKVFLQTSIDDGATWIDVASHAYATTDAVKVSTLSPHVAPASQGFAPADGALADNTVVNGVFGSQWRVKRIVAGTYAATTLAVEAELRRR